MQVDVPSFEEIAHLRGKHAGWQLRRLVVDDLLADAEIVEFVHLGVRNRPACCQLEEDQPDAPDVAFVGVAFRLTERQSLRTPKIATIIHVSHSSNDGSSSGMLDAFANPKVCDLDLSLGVQQYVLRLDIAMYGMPDVMDIMQSIQDLSKSITTLKIIAAISSSESTNFLAATNWITFLSAPMSIYSITCLTSPSWKKQV